MRIIQSQTEHEPKVYVIDDKKLTKIELLKKIKGILEDE